MGVHTDAIAISGAVNDHDAVAICLGRIRARQAEAQAACGPYHCSPITCVSVPPARGEWVVGTIPQDYGANVTMLAAVVSPGVEAVTTLDNATDNEVVRAYVEQVVFPTLCRRTIVLRQGRVWPTPCDRPQER
jgi:hypothetical protein